MIHQTAFKRVVDFQKWFLFIDTLNDISKINY